MTSTVESESIAEALAIIDKNLMNLVKRELVSSTEVADVLLDVRTLLSTVEPLDGN
jgi:hypothetical protein